MAERDSEILTEVEAAQLWERAAQLQAEAARRIEAPDVADDETTASGYALSHVRAAALEAGIGNEFVDAALADLRSEQARPAIAKATSLAKRFLGNPPDALVIKRIVEATPEEVMAAMEGVFPGDQFRLALVDQQGDPLDRGVLIFDVQGYTSPFPQGFALEAKWGGFRQVFVSLRAIDGPARFCEMTVHAPVISHNVGLLQGVIAGAIPGGAGMFVGTAIGMGLLGVAPVAVVLAGVGLLTGGGLGVKGYRAVYHYCMRRGTAALEGLAGAVALRATGVWNG
jgi:hypothetical protein